MLRVVKLSGIILSFVMLSVVMLSVVKLSGIILRFVMLSVVMLSVVMLSVVKLSGIILSVVMLSVVAPYIIINIASNVVQAEQSDQKIEKKIAQF
jgi:hypothetical protein